LVGTRPQIEALATRGHELHEAAKRAVEKIGAK